MEIVVRAAVIFMFLWLVTRVVGRSTLGELSTFQLLLYVTMGDLVQQSVTQQDYSVTSGVLAVSVFALLTILVSWANTRWRRIRPLVHGVPVVIMKAVLRVRYASEKRPRWISRKWRPRRRSWSRTSSPR